MKRLILISILFLFSLEKSNFSFAMWETVQQEYDQSYQQYKKTYFYVYYYCRLKNDSAMSHTLTEYILQYTEKYGLDAKSMTRQGWMESGLQCNLKPSKAKSPARGIFQVTRHYDHLLFLIDSGSLGRHIKKYKVASSKWNYYYYYPKYNIEMACIIMSQHIKKYKCEELALMAYLYGPNSKEFKYYSKNISQFRKGAYYRWYKGVYDLFPKSINM